jgi:transcriptional regulator with XRE-family HTH domain
MMSASKQQILQIGAALKKRRIALGLKQKEAAARAGVTLPTLRKFEQTGQISLERFMKLCRIYRMDMHVLNAIEQRDWWALEEIRRAESKRTVR